MKGWLASVAQKLESMVPAYSKVGDSVFFTNEQFPFSYELEANWKVIREELDQVMLNVDDLPNFHDISPRQVRIAGDNLWKTYFFWAFGFKSKANCDRCPETVKLLKKVPGLKVAFFSILAPGKHIPEHRGKHKGLIRYHLGLKVPEKKEACRIRVADQFAHWEEGKSLIFDDTFYHEVWNDTDEYRAVLFLDIARPLRFPLSLVNGLVNFMIGVSPIVQVARRNHATWEKHFEDILK
ncbi:aspartyl/asparaginyl beta-hydroxylase domain-containing protein [Leptolyngbya sp. FACHB-16]|uniref:aspartyl/asparaginyl beta-hydroxylase domain-containing protein n=2 Tax=Leptolyngbya TaxID=47251 RepID=UPI00168A35E8|nr:aspartyl/asparaginyl beta-hydroxylase domain-containing protein [Leptolyngbya sp. FACHB-16]MBD1913130.1 aspartyl/asparaginyl beta-hydroxylase domain-containing protein [Leptolyngbya sp. FACHB-8]MBD2157826.1 aspartyl/asparaginyl beta-hydroxylase domain-containing protein [Leptolyngbya sp. FACHB-16]